MTDGKWLRLLITGEPVTWSQTNEIMVRTNSWYLETNDVTWLRLVAREFGIPLGTDARPSYRGIREVYEELGVLPLKHLSNHRIVSNWLGGPNGWCDWDGTIGCSTWNIGKWPNLSDVDRDLDLIAEAFPFLRAHVQLITDEGDGGIAATWAVRRGKAARVEPAGLIRPVGRLDVALALENLNAPGRERGVSLPRLRKALAQVRAARRRLEGVEGGAG